MTPALSQRVLVTGGASGLGAALVRAYVARGADVLVADITPSASAAASGTHGGATHPLRGSGLPPGPAPRRPAPSTAPPRAPESAAPTADSKPPGSTTQLRLDVRSEEDWAAALAWVGEHWGGLDVLVNNAGVAGGGRVDVATMDEWEWITQINLFGVVRGTRTFVPMFKRQRAGQIVNIASLAGLVHPAGMASYNAVKAGVVAFTETLGHELAAYGVRASVVCPSYFRTGLVDAMQGEDKAVGAVIGQLVANSPLGPDDIAAAILAGLDEGAELILPDDAARQAYALKLADRPAYDALMRKQAARLDQASSR